MQGGLGRQKARECSTTRLMRSQEDLAAGVSKAKFMDLREKRNIDASVANENAPIPLVNRGKKLC